MRLCEPVGWLPALLSNRCPEFNIIVTVGNKQIMLCDSVFHIARDCRSYNANRAGGLIGDIYYIFRQAHILSCTTSSSICNMLQHHYY